MNHFIGFYFWHVVAWIACEFHFKGLLNAAVNEMKRSLSGLVEAFPNYDFSEIQFLVTELERLEKEIS